MLQISNTTFKKKGVLQTFAEAVLANETNKVCFEIDFSNKSKSLT
jgi:hypothetical protein